jgi:uncharacterized protein YbjT (DUF2867 family)
MYVVAGVSGKTGGAVASQLLARGLPVRALVRDPAKAAAWRARGAEVAVAALDDRPALAQALAGAAGLYALLPEDPTDVDFRGRRLRIADALAAAVEAARVPAVALLSTTSAFMPAGNGPAAELHQLERRLRETGTRLSVIRCCYFQDNTLAALPAARQDGVFPCFLPADIPFPTVAAGDVGALAARLLQDHPTHHQVIDFLGPAYSLAQMAQALGRALDRPLRVIEVPPPAQLEALLAAGLARPAAEAVAEMFACIASGRVSPQGDRVERATTTIEETLAAGLGTRQ